MASADHDPADRPTDETEAFRTLLSLAHGKTPPVPEELVVRHVMRITQGGDWPLRRAALEACLRRFDFAARDELRIAARPPGGRPFGTYRTRRARSRQRPYETLLENLDPLSGSCECADYLRGSLGLCKHLLAVIGDLHGRPRLLREAMSLRSRDGAQGRARLVWDPVRSLVGPGDWLERVRLEPGSARDKGGAAAAAVAAARVYFRRAEDGALILRDAFAGSPQRRLDLVEALVALCGRGGRAAHPALRPLLSQEKDRLGQVVSIRGARRRLQAALRTLKRSLYPFQVEGVLQALDRGRFLLADDMGLGKTAQAIATCHALWHCGLVRRGTGDRAGQPQAAVAARMAALHGRTGAGRRRRAGGSAPELPDTARLPHRQL